MKKLLLGVLLGLFAFPLMSDLSGVVVHTYPSSEAAQKAWLLLAIPGYGTQLAFTGMCTKDSGENGHGQKFESRRQYFSCGKLNIAISDLIYGEYEDGSN